jgi:hypothetical protein
VAEGTDRAPEERRVTEGEDSSVGGDQPVSPTGRRGRYGDDGSEKPQPARPAGEHRVAVGEYPTIAAN